MKFKTTYEQAEWDQLKATNPRLVAIVGLLDQYCLMEFKKEITLTEVFRTKAEDDALYAPTPVEQRPNNPSPHCSWRAVDIRSKDFTEAQIKKMVSFLNHITVWGGKKNCAMYHAIAGGAYHIHLQAPPSEDAA